MNALHRTTPWAWTLARGEARTLEAAGVARWLRVDEGCVWLTPVLSHGQADDVWLGAGESVALPAGSRWVVEAWPQARLSLLLRPATVARGSSWRWPSWLKPAWRASLLHA